MRCLISVNKMIIQLNIMNLIMIDDVFDERTQPKQGSLVDVVYLRRACNLLHLIQLRLLRFQTSYQQL